MRYPSLFPLFSILVLLLYLFYYTIYHRKSREVYYKNDFRLRRETIWVNEKHVNENKLEKPRATVVLKL